MPQSTWVPRPQGQLNNIMFQQGNQKEVVFSDISGRSVFRVQPGFDAAGSPTPWRTGPGRYDIGGWIMSVPCAFWWGLAPVSFVDVPTDQRDKYPEGVAFKCARMLNLAVKTGQHPEFDPLLKGRNRVQYPGQLGFVQVVLFEHGGKKLDTPYPCIFMLKSSAMGDLEAWLNETKDGSAVTDENWKTAFKLENLLDQEKGLIWVVRPVPMQTQGRAAQQQQGHKFGNKQGGFMRFELSFAEQPYALPNDYAKSQWVAWDRVLNFPDRKTCWQLVTKAIGIAATAFSGQDEPENLPSVCRDLAVQFHHEMLHAGGINPVAPSPSGYSDPAGGYTPPAPGGYAPVAPAQPTNPPAAGQAPAMAVPTIPDSPPATPAAPSAAPATVASPPPLSPPATVTQQTSQPNVAGGQAAEEFSPPPPLSQDTPAPVPAGHGPTGTPPISAADQAILDLNAQLGGGHGEGQSS